MEFGLLGPIMVRCGPVLIPVQPGKQRAVLATLLLHAGQVVPVDGLAEALWGSAPPPSAPVTVRNYVRRLRAALGDSASRISTHRCGYQLSLDRDELDVNRFEALLTAARAAAREGSWDVAAAQAGTALSLWRGEPLADVESEVLALREVPRLAEIRLMALETRIDADLHLGRHADVIAELRHLAGAHPLRERLHAQLMRALYRDGRQAEAFAAYARARQVLVDELGTEPGPELKELQQRMLAADPVLAVASPLPAPAPAPAPGAMVSAAAGVPRQLPAAIPLFVGRSDELAALDRLLDQSPGGTPGTVLISAIGGTAGVGKTALAVHWAHRVAARFPDGQLYLNLRGYDPGPPIPAADVLAGFLRALGVPGQDIPTEEVERAARYRSLLAGKRMLIVLDNARDEQQVRPLLPGTPGCVVVVTSRCQLNGLAIAEGACPVTLDVLSEAEARDLLGRRLGASRVAAEPGAVAELTGLCARLPLALSVTGSRAATHPDRKIATMAAELRDARDRLDGLATGDRATSVRAVFSWSYQNLSEPAARVFRLLALHPGPDITVPAAASLAGISVRRAKEALGELTRASLLTEHLRGRFACHDLLRAYAAEKSGTLSRPTAERRAAVGRLISHYLHTTYRADRLLYPKRASITLEPLVPGAAPERFDDHTQALAWLDAERQVLLAATRLAADEGLGVFCWQLAWALETFFYRRHHVHDWASTQRIALGAARRLDDRYGQACAHRGIANALVPIGDYQEAHAHFNRALALRRQLGDEAGEALIMLDVTRLLECQQRHSMMLRSAQQALRLYRGISDRWGEAIALNHVGWSLGLRGDYVQALVHCQQGLVIMLALGENHHAAGTLDSLGYAHSHLGHHARAAACYRRAVELCAELGYSYKGAEILIYAGDAHHAAGDPLAAQDAWQEALRILDELHHPDADQFRARVSAAGLAGHH
jgi:DNA-binding SARP family transcriptional activator